MVELNSIIEMEDSLRIALPEGGRTVGDCSEVNHLRVRRSELRNPPP